MLCCGVQGREELSTSVAFQDVTTCAGIEDGEDQFLRFDAGENQNLGGRAAMEDLPCRIEAIELRHPDIDHGDVRTFLLSERYGLTTIGCLGADRPSGFSLDETAEAFSNEFVVVSEKDASWSCIHGCRVGNVER